MSNLAAKLKQKLREKSAERTTRVVRDNRLEKLYEDLNNCKDKKKKKAIQKEIDMLENIEQKEIDSFNPDFRDSTDPA